MAKRSQTQEPFFSDNDPPGPDTLAKQNGKAEKPLVIHELRVENFKRLSVARVTPEGSLVQITGKNAQGKSSVLDAIAAALGGASNAPSEPVNRGHDSAEIILDLGELKVRRTFSKGGSSTLTVLSGDGSKLKSPQQVLDALYGYLSFDPLGFIRMEPKKQRDLLLFVSGLTDRLEKIKGEKAMAEQARLEAGREVKRLEGALATLPEVPDDTPDEEVSADDIAEEMAKATETATQNAKRRQWFAAKQAEEVKLNARIAELEAELAQARTALDKVKVEIAEYGPRVAALKDPDTEAMRRKLTERETINAAVRAKRSRAKVEQDLAAARKLHSDHNRRVGDLDISANVLLETAELPVRGVVIADDEIRVKSGSGTVPLAQASTAQQLTLAVQLGLATSPRIRVMLVREGSFLDSDQRALLAQIAEAHGAQVWMERVTDGESGVGVVIENGEVREGGEA